MRDRLIELLNDKTAPWHYLLCPANIRSLADYLLTNGVIVPPCKVGDTVYQVDTKGQIYESTIKQVIYDVGHFAFDERAIGKSVFLTKEEAEQALKGGVE